MTEEELDAEIAELEARIKIAREQKAERSQLTIMLARRRSTRDYINYLRAWLPTL